MPRVLISQFGTIPHFRVRFFQLLEQRRPKHWDFAVLYDPDLAARRAAGYGEKVGDHFRFPVVQVSIRRVGPRHAFHWMGLPPFGQKQVRAIITDTQLHNLSYAMCPFLGRWTGVRWGAWGHVGDRQAALQPGLLKRCVERIKLGWMRQADHFFAYTDEEGEVARQRLGLPPGRVTVLNNTIDVTTEMASADRALEEGGRTEGERRLELEPTDSPRLLTICRLTRGRGMDRLSQVIRQTLHQDRAAQWTVIGDGDERSLLAPLVEQFPGRFRLPGAITDSRELAWWFATSDLYVLPGWVGLGVVHSFAHGVPALIWENGIHSPEIGYCHAGNSARVPGGLTVEEEARAILETAGGRLGGSARQAIQDSVRHLTLEAMADRMIAGIDALLSR